MKQNYWRSENFALLKAGEIEELTDIALKVREHIVRMSTDGGCFLGASLSCADLLVYLYKKYLNVSPHKLNDPERDYLFLSKGHDVPALYGVFAETGFIAKDRLKNHLKTNDHIYWHPNRLIPGIEYYSGSLGHLLSVAMGVALDCRMKVYKNRIIVILGDGELNEGSVWESMLVAHAFKLDNLLVIVDRNGFQANMPTEELIPLEPLENKFAAFGWTVLQVDGHNFVEMHEIFWQTKKNVGYPQVVIAETVRGKGLPSIQERADRWFCNFTSEEVNQLLNELHGKATSDLKSETLTVR